MKLALPKTAWEVFVNTIHHLLTRHWRQDLRPRRHHQMRQWRRVHLRQIHFNACVRPQSRNASPPKRTRWRNHRQHMTGQHGVLRLQYLGNDAAELRPVLSEGQQVADGTADGVDVVRWVNLFDQDLQEPRNATYFVSICCLWTVINTRLILKDNRGRLWVWFESLNNCGSVPDSIWSNMFDIYKHQI